MRLRFSRITLGFAAVGFGLGLVCVAISCVHAMGNESINAAIRHITDLMLIFCPPSLALMALENKPDWFDLVFVYSYIIVLNTLIYGAIGLVISTFFRLTKKKT